MVNLAKDVAFSGVEKFFPDESQPGAQELARRLESFSNSLIDRLRVQPTVYTNSSDDPPVGMKEGDIWIAATSMGVYRYDGLSWVSILVSFTELVEHDPGSVSAVDHGALSGLLDDDHTQYLKEKVAGGLAGEIPVHTHQAAAECGQIDHGLANVGLGDDDHTQYALLAGRAGGQVINGGGGAGDDLTLQSNDDVLIQPTGGNVGIGTNAPTEELEIQGQLLVVSPTYAPFEVYRTSSSTNTLKGAFRLRHKTSANMVDGFGVSYIMSIEDSGVLKDIAQVTVIRDGADDSGLLTLQTKNAGAWNASAFVIDHLANVGIGTTGPDRKLDVLDASAPQLRLTHTDNAVYADFQVDGSGDLAITCTGTMITLNDLLFLTSIKSGATQAAAGAAANEVWKTNGHASLPNNVLMIGV